jgi:hypothetical protein
LPGIIKHKPTLIHRLVRDHSKFANIIKKAREILDPHTKHDNFFGIQRSECVKLAWQFANTLENRKLNQHSRTLTLRLRPQDIECLKNLRQKLHLASVSQVIRYLAAQKEMVLTSLALPS